MLFNFFIKKTDPNNIKTFQDLIDLIELFINQKKWEDAYKIIDKAIIIEKDSAKKQIKELNGIDDKYEENKKYIEEILKNHLDKLEKLKYKLILEEEKYKFIPEKIKKFDDAIRSIKTLIALEEWEKSRTAIEDIRKIEKKAFEDLLIKIEKGLRTTSKEYLLESEKKKQLKIYSKKNNKLNNLLEELEKKEKKYKQKIEKQKFEIKFKKIKQEIEFLRKTGKNSKALNLLKHYLEENSSNPKIIKFYNKNKEIILKNIEREKKIKEKKLEISIKQEAEKLIGKTIKFKEEKKQEKISFFEKIKKEINFYKKLQQKIKRKKLLDEVTLLIEEEKNLNSEITKKKLEHIHQGLVKEIGSSKIIGYDLYGKILGADKISGDTFDFEESKDKYNFFIGDATGHGIKAGLIVTLITRLFKQNANKKSLAKLAMIINNGLKQDLKSRNFITSVIFEINKKYKNILQFVGMGHEAILVYRANQNKVEKIIPGGLAAGIRLINNISHIKVREIKFDNQDILLTYSDGIIEAKSIEGKYYGIERLKEQFLKICQIEKDTKKIYKYLIDDLVFFRGGAAFLDDVTLLLLKRDKNLDLLNENSEIIKKIKFKEKLEKNDIKKLEGKNKQEVLEELKEIKKEKQLKAIVRNLKKLYHLGEFLKLKQEATRYMKDGWVNKDIVFYFKKALDNELKYKINLKNKKIEGKYFILEQLYKKGDYDTVIREIQEIIRNDGEI